MVEHKVQQVFERDWTTQSTKSVPTKATTKTTSTIPIWSYGGSNPPTSPYVTLQSLCNVRNTNVFLTKLLYKRLLWRRKIAYGQIRFTPHHPRESVQTQERSCDLWLLDAAERRAPSSNSQSTTTIGSRDNHKGRIKISKATTKAIMVCLSEKEAWKTSHIESINIVLVE